MRKRMNTMIETITIDGRTDKQKKAEVRAAYLLFAVRVLAAIG